MKVLMVASEAAPVLKLGGLGDVVGSLPKELQKLGVDVDIIIPYFPNAKTTGLDIFKSMDIEIPFANKVELISIYKTKLPNSDVDVLLVKSPNYFDSYQQSAFANNISETEIFTFFSACVVEYIKTKYNTYDVVHCNDWHTGLITHLLEDALGVERPGTLFTIHNLMYQGEGDAKIIQEVGIVPGEHRQIDEDIKDGTLNLISQGIMSSDFVTTVSPTYAKEILTEEFGKNMTDVLRAREGRLSGILNGVDYSAFPRNYDITDYEESKHLKKIDLQNKLNLSRSDTPIFSFVSRLDPYQKGLDILYEVVPDILEKGGQFILLGSGNEEWEKKFIDLMRKYESGRNISVNIKFNVDLANDIYMGSDFFLVPSRYEPCGLTQMISMWYGTLPIVHGVGGLKDSVEHAVNGFVFDGYVATNLLKAVNKGFDVYSKPTDKDLMIKHAMRSDFSWKGSAEKYLEIYKKIVKFRNLNL